MRLERANRVALGGYNLHIADGNSHVVEHVSLATGQMNITAGNGVAGETDLRSIAPSACRPRRKPFPAPSNSGIVGQAGPRAPA